MAQLRRQIPAGLIDAGASSLATFAAGLFAARRLDADVLGVYALFFSGFTLAFAVPGNLLFIPATVTTIDMAPTRRLHAIAPMLGPGCAISLLSAATAVALCAMLTPRVGDDVVVPLSITACAAASIWPIQDYVRSMLHMSDGSWLAATMSVVNCLVVVAALVGAGSLGAPSIWLPFGALVIGNLASLLVATPRLVAAARRRVDVAPLGRVLRSGRYYLLIGGMPIAATFVVSVVVSRLAGASALGNAEAARIVAQPVTVLAIGIQAVTGPRSLAAGAVRDYGAARRLGRVYVALVLSCGLAAIALIGWRWPLNVVVDLVPQAYVVPGLVAVTLIANMLHMAANPFRSELLGAGRESQVARVDVSASLLQCITALSAPAIGAFARPAALATQGVVQTAWLHLASNRLLSVPRSPAAVPPGARRMVAKSTSPPGESRSS